MTFKVSMSPCHVLISIFRLINIIQDVKNSTFYVIIVIYKSMFLFSCEGRASIALYLYHRCLSSSRRRAPRLKWRPQQQRCPSRSRVRLCSAPQRSASPSCSGGPPNWRATCWPADGTACATPHSKHSSWTLASRWQPGSGSVRAHRGFGSGRLHRDWSAARDTAIDSATFASGRAPVPTTGTSWADDNNNSGFCYQKRRRD